MKDSATAIQRDDTHETWAVEPRTVALKRAESGVRDVEPRHRVLVVADEARRGQLVRLVGPGYDVHTITSNEAEEVLENTGADFVLASAEACTQKLLAVIAGHGLARRCVFLAQPSDLEGLAQAYAAQFEFRVLSHDVPVDAFRSFLRTLLFPRQTQRRSLPEISVELEHHDRRVSTCTLLDLSNGGLAARMDAEDGLLLPGVTIPGIRLFRGDTLLLDGVTATVRHVEVVAARSLRAIAYKIGLQFHGLPKQQAARNERLLVEPVRVRGLLLQGLRRGPLMLWLAATDCLVVIGNAEVSASGSEIVMDAVPTKVIEVGDVVEGRFELAGYNYSFLSSVAALGARVHLHMPRAVRGVRERRSIRFAPEKSRPLLVTPLSPFTGRLAARPALNITASGAAFELTCADELLPIGSRLPELNLHLYDGTVLTCRASVRSLSCGAGRENPICGIEFEGLSITERARIANLIAHAERSDLQDGSGIPFADLWRFLVESHFLYPQKLATLDVPGIARTMTPLLSRPNDLLKTTLVVDDNGIQAHVAALRAYERTCILQHLASRPGGRGDLGRGRIMNLALIQYLEQLPGIEWVKIWFRPQNPWPARMFGTFARKLADPCLSRIRTYGYMVSCTDGARVIAPEVTVRPALEADLVDIEAYFVAHGESVLIAADDLERDRLRLSNVTEAYRELGLERRREILIAERAGKTVGFALLEISSPGLNFSEITDSFRVFPNGNDVDALRALVSRARERYAEIGRSRAIGFASGGELGAFEATGFTRAREYACWTWHRSLYQDFCEHVRRRESDS